MWFCKRCNKERDAQYDHGKPKVRAMWSGFVGVILECGHVAAVSKDKVRPPA